jgi:hypothetical protein
MKEKEGEEKKKTKEIENATTSAVPSTTSVSMNYLLEGFGTLPPFMKSIVDVRDSLSYQMKTSIPLMDSSDLEQLSTTVGFWVATGVCHLLETHEGMSAVSHLSPHNICFCPDGTIVITCFDLSGIEEGKGKNFSEEWRRYSSPEMLKGEIREGNEKSVVFVLGMTMNSILNKEIPFKDVDCISAGELIVSGKRPSTSLIEKKYKEWMKILSSSVLDNPKERSSIDELKKEMDRLTPLIMNENGNEIEKNKEREKKKEKEPTVSI